MTSHLEGANETPSLLGNWLPVLEDRFAGAERLSLCLDFDGTLAPIVADPDRASVPACIRQALSELLERPRVDVAVVSGRGLEDLRERVPVEGCALAGNHGLEIDRGDERWVHPAVDDRRDGLERIAERLRRRFEPRAGCQIEDKRLTVTVHYRRADVGREAVLPSVERVVADDPGFETVDGDQVVEVRPAVDWDKGDAVRELTGDRSTAVYVGDDTTDEDAFVALDGLAGGVGILVGDRPSTASFRVHDVDGVRAFLEWLVETPTPAASRVPEDDVPRTES